MAIKPSITTQEVRDPQAAYRQAKEGVTRRQARVAPVHHMRPKQRRAAFHRGDLTIEQALSWAARHPRQLPLINGEFAFIAATTPEALITCPTCQGEVTDCGSKGTLQNHPDERHPLFGTPNGFADDIVPACPAVGKTLAVARKLATEAVR